MPKRVTCSLHSGGFAFFRSVLQSDETFLNYRSDHMIPLLKSLTDRQVVIVRVSQGLVENAVPVSGLEEDRVLAQSPLSASLLSLKDYLCTIFCAVLCILASSPPIPADLIMFPKAPHSSLSSWPRGEMVLSVGNVCGLPFCVSCRLLSIYL